MSREVIGRLAILIGADSSDLEKQLKQTESKLKGFGSAVKTLSIGVAGAYAAAGASACASATSPRAAAASLCFVASRAASVIASRTRLAASTVCCSGLQPQDP